MRPVLNEQELAIQIAQKRLGRAAAFNGQRNKVQSGQVQLAAAAKEGQEVTPDQEAEKQETSPDVE